MIKTDKSLPSTYKPYSVKAKNPVDYQKYKEVNIAYYNLIIKKVLEGWEVTLPKAMGTVCIVGTKREKYFDDKGNSLLPPDWVKTKALWDRDEEAKRKKTLVRHLNEETGGVSYRFKWRKFSVPLRNKNFVSFRLTRNNKRIIHKEIKKGKEFRIIKIIE